MHRAFDYEEDYDADRLVAMIASRSQTILLPPDERDRLLDAVRRSRAARALFVPVCVPVLARGTSAPETSS